MEIEVEITRDDFKEFNKYTVKNKKIYRKIILILFALFICFIILVNIKNISNISFMVRQLIIATVIYFGMFMILMPLSMFLIKHIPLKKGATLGKHKFVITEEGLLELTEYNKTLTKWPGIQSIETNTNYIFVFIDNYMGHIIPKRYFSSEDDCKKFLSNLNDRISKSKDGFTSSNKETKNENSA